jgi:hypothetical protein
MSFKSIDDIKGLVTRAEFLLNQPLKREMKQEICGMLLEVEQIVKAMKRR